MGARPVVFTFVDRVIAAIDPVRGLRRVGARVALEQIVAATSPYEADTPGRHRKFYTDRHSPNQLTDKSARAIRAQARQLQRNHDVSRGIIRTLVNNVVGPSGIGIEPQPRRADGTLHEEYAAALRRAWTAHQRYPEVTRLHPGAEVQRLMVGGWIRDGESFAADVVGKQFGVEHASAVPFSLELFEADLVPYDYRPNDRTHQGIERNAWGRPTAYYVLKGHPGDALTLSANDVKRVDAMRIYHLAMRDRVGQMRGVSEFASIITRLEDIKDYEESERIAAKIAAALTAFVKRQPADGEGYQPNVDEKGQVQPRSLGLAPGVIIDNLAVGEEIGIIKSDRPNPNLITFRQGQLRAIVAGVGASYSSVAKDYNGTYSAQRQELVEQWVNYATLTDKFVGGMLQPWYSTFVSIGDISGALPIPPDVVRGTEDDALFIAQSMPWIDPLKEAEAYTALVQAGFGSELEVLRKRGLNPRDVLEQIRTWRKKVAEAGLVFSSDAANVNPAGGTRPPEPQPSNQEGQA